LLGVLLKPFYYRLFPQVVVHGTHQPGQPVQVVLPGFLRVIQPFGLSQFFFPFGRRGMVQIFMKVLLAELVVFRGEQDEIVLHLINDEQIVGDKDFTYPA